MDLFPRGFLVQTFGESLFSWLTIDHRYVGAIVAAWGSFGSGHLNNSWSWRIPSIIQGVAPIFLLIMLPFMPESPRYLLSIGKPEQARAVLAEYHANGALDDDLVNYEIDEINQSLALERKFEHGGWSLLWATPGNRRKMLIAMSSFMICLWLVFIAKLQHIAGEECC